MLVKLVKFITDVMWIKVKLKEEANSLMIFYGIFTNSLRLFIRYYLSLSGVRLNLQLKL
jgi:hypothetical protein